MESKWKDKVWYKRLFIAMYVAKTSHETQLEVQKQLEALDEELAEFQADTLYRRLESSRVEEQFLYAVRSGISYWNFLFALMSKHNYSWDARYLAIQYAPGKIPTKERTLISKAIVDIIRSSTDENEFVEKMENFNPNDYVLETEDAAEIEPREEEHIPEVIKVCKELGGTLEQVVITLRDGTLIEGRVHATILPDRTNDYSGAVYMYTNTGKTVRILPTDISSLKIDENYDSRFESYYKMEELYNAIMNTDCVGKRISAIHNYADETFMVSGDFVYDSEDEERSCYTGIDGPVVIEFEDGTNVAFSTFMGPTFGVTKNFTGEYEGDGKPNIDINIFFKRIIGKCITKVELESFPLSIGEKDSEYDVCVYPKDDVPDELVAEIHLCLDDGTIFEIKEYGEYGLLEPDKSMACITVKDLWEACGIPEEYA